MRELLDDPTMRDAIACLREENLPMDGELQSDANVSVRLLNRMLGYDNCIKALLCMAENPPVIEPEQDPTFGVNLDEFKKPIPQP